MSAAESAGGFVRRVEAPVRTPELPMAFTWEEFRGGAVRAWWMFQWVYPLSYPAIVLIMATASGSFDTLAYQLMWSLYGVVIAFLWTFVCSLVAVVFIGAPLAWLLGRALWRVRARAVHLALFALLGVVIGAGVSTFAVPMGDETKWYFVALAVVVAGVAVPYGWWRAASRALRGDQQHYSPDGTDP